MKTTSISTQASAQAIRSQLARMQAELIKVEKEVVTGKVADSGLKLGARSGEAVSLTRDVERLNGIVDSNALVSSRLASSQQGLNQIANLAQEMLSALTAASTGQTDPSVMKNAASTTLDSLTGVLNTSLNGEHLFAGVNTDIVPINEYSDGSGAKTAFEAAFQGYFGFTKNDPAASGITSAQMDDFLTTAVEPQFMGSGWEANWSNATDETIVSRISLTETAQSSVSANNVGVRKLAMASAIVAELADSAIGQNARDTLATRASSLAGEAVADIADLQAQTGIVESRVTSASERISMQIDLFEGKINDLEGVDPYEASTRVSTLLSQIETAYTLTSRISQLSLVRYLP